VDKHPWNNSDVDQSSESSCKDWTQAAYWGNLLMHPSPPFVPTHFPYSLTVASWYYSKISCTLMSCFNICFWGYPNQERCAACTQGNIREHSDDSTIKSFFSALMWCSQGLSPSSQLYASQKMFSHLWWSQTLSLDKEALSIIIPRLSFFKDTLEK
jgi:hypothetical protein